jgi:hypothetical protein
VIDRHLATGLGREGLRPLHPFGEPRRRDERRNPAIAHPPGPAHRGLAVAADPQRERALERLRQHRDAIELPELAVEGDLVLLPAAPHDRDGLVRAPAALLEGHAGRQELALLLHADAERRQHPAVRQVVDHRQLARHHDR